LNLKKITHTTSVVREWYPLSELWQCCFTDQFTFLSEPRIWTTPWPTSRPFRPIRPPPVGHQRPRPAVRR